MIDRNRNPDPGDTGPSRQIDRRRDDDQNELEEFESAARADTSSVADDAGFTTRQRRSFAGDREYDELSTDIDDDLGWLDRGDDDDSGRTDR